ncbi:hypothetical protein ACLK14_13660 [Escherichia coli]
MSARIAGRWATHLRIRVRWISSCARGKWIQPPYQSRFAAAGTGTGSQPERSHTQLVVQPLGWYNEPLTVVMHGDNAPQRGERLFVGLQHARLYNGDERIETPDEELALAQAPEVEDC